MEMDSALTLYSYSAWLQHLFLHLKRWSTVGLRDYRDDWAWGPVTTYNSGAHNHKQGQTPSLQFPHL